MSMRIDKMKTIIIETIDYIYYINQYWYLVLILAFIIAFLIIRQIR